MIDRWYYSLRASVARFARLALRAALVLPLLVAAPLSARQASAGSAGDFVNTLMPLPTTLANKPGSLAINNPFTYSLNANGGAFVSQGAIRLIDRLRMRTGVPISKTPATAGTSATLTIDVLTPTHETVPQLGDDESYTLDVDPQHISLRAKTWIGALYGVQTLSQLVQPSGDHFVFPSVHIEDAPRFPWRGLMLDPGRHFLPVPVIYRTLDGMAAVKLNVLHWHLTEDQGFRIESRVYPKLQELGSGGQYYTQQQVRDVIAYAAARGIRVVPEFDMPGHSTSWMVGYPELGSAPGPYYVIAETFGIHDAAMNPIRESTYRFLDGFLGEMAQLFPDEYIHIGGDESNGKEWRSNPAIVAFMKAHNMTDTKELQAYFNQRVQKILAKHHKQMVGWDEILSPNLPRQAVIQNWHGIEFLINAAKQGHRTILSHPYYLDHMYSAADMFLADPLPANSGLTPEQARLILGGEACMWGEDVIPQTIDSRIWPRAAAVAERFWSPASDRDVNDMYRRLGVESLRLDAEGVPLLSGPERGLRQLAGTEQDQALSLFASTLQPVDFSVRMRQQHPSAATVFNRLVDAVRPDPPLKHAFQLLVDGALQGNTADMDKLDALFHSWMNAAPALDQLEAGSPLLQEASVHIATWPKLGQMGIDAISALRSGKAPPAGWQDAQNAVLKQAVDPHELVDFAILGPLEKLVNAAVTTKGQ
ncbi:MAG: beta-N-acetylhexosaminidase [Acidobacteriota bacterium]